MGSRLWRSRRGGVYTLPVLHFSCELEYMWLRWTGNTFPSGRFNNQKADLPIRINFLLIVVFNRVG